MKLVYALFVSALLCPPAAAQTLLTPQGGGHQNEDCYEGSVDAPIPHCHGTPGPQGPMGPQGQAGPIGPAGPQGIQGPAGADGAPGRDGVDGKDGESNLIVVRETDVHADWDIPIPFVPGVDLIFAIGSATPDKFGSVGYYYRAPGKYQGWLVIVDIPTQQVLAFQRGGEVAVWDSIVQVQERTFVFTGLKNGVAHSCLINLARVIAYVTRKTAAPLMFSLQDPLFRLKGEIPQWAVLPEVP